MNKIKDRLNGNRFIPVDGEEKTALELIKKVVDKSNEIIEQVNTFESEHNTIKETVNSFDYKVTQYKQEVDKLPTINANAEILDARCGKNTLGDFNRDISSQLETKAKQIDLEIERKRIDSLARLGEGSTTGDAELIDGRIGADGITYANIGNSIRNQVNKKINKYVNKSLVFGNTGGLLLNGNSGSYGTWLFTDFIDISENEYLYIVASGYKGTVTPLAFYDSNKNFIKSLTENDGKISSIVNSTDLREYNIECIVEKPTNAKYCKISATKNSGTSVDTKPLCKLFTITKNIMVVDECFVGGEKINNIINSTNDKINSINDKILNIEKTNSFDYILTTFGDSVTEFAGWQPKLIQKMGLTSYNNCGLAGSPIAKTSSVCMNQDTRINTIPTNTTLCLFMGGINDWNGSYPIGTISRTNEDVNTFCGALNVTIKKLITRLPNARIVCMSPTWASSEYKLTNGDSWGNLAWINGQGLTIYDYRDVFKKVCEWWSVPFIDLLSKMNVNYINQDYYILQEKEQSTNQPLRHHPNEQGYDRMVKIIYNELNNILN